METSGIFTTVTPAFAYYRYIYIQCVEFVYLIKVLLIMSLLEGFIYRSILDRTHHVGILFPFTGKYMGEQYLYILSQHFMIHGVKELSFVRNTGVSID